jgi:hypothetical protein
MIPVYYFDKMPEVLPEDDACYIVSKYIYLKKRSGLIDSMVRVESIDMGEILPEYANISLPKIKAKVFGQVQGFFKMTYGKYKSEAGVILNLKTHPQKPTLKKLDYTVPHQKVSGAGCHYQIVVDPKYVNCGTIHSHANFGAFHSGTDINDEKYFDGLHITVGHNDQEKISIAACVVVNAKRIKVNPLNYIEGIKFVETFGNNDFYEFIDKSLVVGDPKYLDYVTPAYTTSSWGSGYKAPATRGIQKEWADWCKLAPTLEDTVPCKECIFKEIKLEDELDSIVFDDDDDYNLFSSADKDFMEKDMSPMFKDGEIDEDGFMRRDQRITMKDFDRAKSTIIKKSLKCECGTTFFVDDPEKENSCPSCETKYPAQRFTFTDFMKMRKQEEWIGK